MYIDTLDDIANKYNNTCHSRIKTKPVDVKSNTYIDSSREVNNKEPKFKISNVIRISKYKNILAKGYTPNWSEEVFLILKAKNMVLCACVINDLHVKELFTKTNCKKHIKKSSEFKK